MTSSQLEPMVQCFPHIASCALEYLPGSGKEREKNMSTPPRIDNTEGTSNLSSQPARSQSPLRIMTARSPRIDAAGGSSNVLPPGQVPRSGSPLSAASTPSTIVLPPSHDVAVSEKTAGDLVLEVIDKIRFAIEQPFPDGRKDCCERELANLETLVKGQPSMRECARALTVILDPGVSPVELFPPPPRGGQTFEYWNSQLTGPLAAIQNVLNDGVGIPEELIEGLHKTQALAIERRFVEASQALTNEFSRAEMTEASKKMAACKKLVENLRGWKIPISAKKVVGDLRDVMVKVLDWYIRVGSPPNRETLAEFDPTFLQDIDTEISTFGGFLDDATGNLTHGLHGVIVFVCRVVFNDVRSELKPELAKLSEKPSAKALRNAIGAHVDKPLKLLCQHLSITESLLDWIKTSALEDRHRKLLIWQTKIYRRIAINQASVAEVHAQVLSSICKVLLASPSTKKDHEYMLELCEWTAKQTKALTESACKAVETYFDDENETNRRFASDGALALLVNACAEAQHDFRNALAMLNGDGDWRLKSQAISSLEGEISAIAATKQVLCDLIDLRDQLSKTGSPGTSPQVLVIFFEDKIPRPCPPQEDDDAPVDEPLPDERKEAHAAEQVDLRKRFNNAAGWDVSAEATKYLTYANNVYGSAHAMVSKETVSPPSMASMESNLNARFKLAFDALDKVSETLDQRQEMVRLEAGPLDDSDKTIKQTMRAFSRTVEEKKNLLTEKRDELKGKLQELKNLHLARLFVARAMPQEAEKLYERNLLTKHMSARQKPMEDEHLDAFQVITRDGGWADLHFKYREGRLVSGYFKLKAQAADVGRHVHRGQLLSRDVQIWRDRMENIPEEPGFRSRYEKERYRTFGV